MANGAEGVGDGPDKTSGDRKSWRDWLGDLFSIEPADRRELLDVLHDASERQLLDREALNIIHGAIAVGDMQARDVMVPRSQVITVPIDARVEDIVPVVIESRHSRLPVVGDDMDDVRGILHAKDMLALLTDDGGSFDFKDYIRPTDVVPESKRLSDLLQQFRDSRKHMAVVVDEYGATAGVVTIEDVLEQIVGDIEDEHDVDDDSLIKPYDDSSFQVKAATPIEDFNNFFDCDFEGSEFDTIGGVVLRQFGHLPDREETVTVDRFRFRVLNSDSRRIRLLHVTRTEAAAP